MTAPEPRELAIYSGDDPSAEVTYSSLESFAAENADGLEPAEIAEVLALKVGEHCRFGGGGGTFFIVARIGENFDILNDETTEGQIVAFHSERPETAPGFLPCDGCGIATPDEGNSASAHCEECRAEMERNGGRL